MTGRATTCATNLPERPLGLRISNHLRDSLYTNYSTDLHSSGIQYPTPHAEYRHDECAVEPLDKCGFIGQAESFTESAFSLGDFDDCLNPFDPIAACGVAHSDDTYSGIAPGIDNVETSLSPQSDVAVASFTNGAAEDTTVTPCVNGINGNTDAVSSFDHNDANYVGYVSNYKDVACAQSPSATLPVQCSDTVCPTGYANASVHISDDGATWETAHGHDNYATNGIDLAAQSTGIRPSKCSNVLPSTPGYASNHPSHHGDTVYHPGYLNATSCQSEKATDNTVVASNRNNINTANATGLATHYASTMRAMSNRSNPQPLASISPPTHVTGPYNHSRWACTACAKTFSRQGDMLRHARKHTGALPYQCLVKGCRYRGSYRLDKLEQHRRNCH